jgi:hypothetical protein
MFNTINVLPAGTYYVGDPCYAIPDEWWQDVLENTGYLGLYASRESMAAPVWTPYDGDKFGMWNYKGFAIGAASTKHGDGTYKDQNGKCYGVDSGTLGAVPIEMIPADDLARIMANPDGQIVEFPYSFVIRSGEDLDGLIDIGHIQIDTDPQYEDDGYDDEDDTY